MPELSSSHSPSSSSTIAGRSSIDARNLVKRYGGVIAVNDVSLEIHQGEFFSLLGPSGAGKTSMLRLLAGFEAPESGSLVIEGRPMAGVPANDRPVNLVFQSYALFPHLRVGENIAFGLEMKRVPRREIEKRVRNMLAVVRLAGMEARWPHELSGGEQQRVALARALVNRPAVLLLDEPLSALDQQLRQQMQIELKSIQELVGITFVCVTHHQHEAMAMSDRVGVMLQGRLVQVGVPREVYERPATLAVARFIGDSNELRGELDGSEEGYSVLRPTGWNGLAIKVRGDGRPPSQRALLLSLRPEQILLSRERPASDAVNVLSGRVDKILYGGHELTYLVRVEPDLLWKAVAPAPRGDAKVFMPGEPVWVSWPIVEGMLYPG